MTPAAAWRIFHETFVLNKKMTPTHPLPDPDAFPDRDVVIYDGQCRICTAAVGRLVQLDRLGGLVGRSGRLSFLSLHDRRVQERFPELTYDRLMEEMVVVDPKGSFHGGADAIRYLSRRLPILWPLMPMLHIPGSAWWWRKMYQALARNRYRWNRHACEEGTCAVHFGSASERQDAGVSIAGSPVAEKR